jgi:hypothetical protein
MVERYERTDLPHVDRERNLARGERKHREMEERRGERKGRKIALTHS